MRTLLLALRNLWRNRRRSLATLLGIAIGSIAILLFGGFKANIKQTMQTDSVRRGGHLQIQHKDYFLYGSGNPTAYSIAEFSAVVEAIKADPSLKDMLLYTTPTLQFGGIAGNYPAGVSRTIIGTGVQASDHAGMREWNRYGLKFDWPRFELQDAAPNAAIVGLGVARVLQLCEALKVPDCTTPERVPAATGASLPDDIAALSQIESKPDATFDAASRKIELLASNPRGAPNVAALEVARAENQGFKEFDDVAVVLQLAQAQRLVYGAASPKVTAIHVQLRDTAMLGAAQQRIESQLAGWSGSQPLVVRDFASLNPFYVQSLQMFDTIFGFIFVLIGGIVMFTVSNTMNTAVTERTVEIGTLRAMGLRRAGIRSLFVTEGMILGIIGAILGVVLALLAAAVVNRLGLEWLPPGSAGRLPLAVAVWGEGVLIAGTSFGLMIITTLSAWWPAYRAARLNVVEALRHV